MYRLSLGFVVATALTAGCTDDGAASPTSTAAITSTAAGVPANGVGLAGFSSCDELLDYFKTEALERVGPYGLDGAYPEVLVDDLAESEDVASTPTGPGANTPAADGDGSTNTQEAGVDEPDRVKSNGEMVVTIAGNRLVIVDVATQTELSTLRLPSGWGHELYIVGDRVIVFMSDDTTATVVVEVDITDRRDPVITTEIRIDGTRLGARRIGDRIRLVTATQPAELPWVFPSNEAGEDNALAANRSVIEASTLDDWLPSYAVVSNDGRSERLSGCGQVNRPSEFSGFEVISVTDLVPDGGSVGIVPEAATAVIADGETVYASDRRMYVATNRWPSPENDGNNNDESESEITTAVHAFSIGADEPTTYVASGSVDGRVLNQFSLDEYEGYLRIITTVTDGGSERSESILTVLAEDNGRLDAVGRVDGLGRGESLYAARLMGDVGFAVTFRQVDPFYVLDLSDPTAPRIAGELKLPGVSTYLHHVGDDQVLGIGRDITDDGVDRGLKLSLFNVSDPEAPVEVSQWTAAGYSPAEYDHRAFQMRGTIAVVPIETYAAGGSLAGANVFDIGQGLEHLGVIRHEPLPNPPHGCRPAELGTAEDNELQWIIEDGGSLEICEPAAAPRAECDPVEDLSVWLSDEDAAAVIDDNEVGDDEQFELCVGDGSLSVIDRSLFLGETIWTFSPDRIQVSSATTLDNESVITL